MSASVDMGSIPSYGPVSADNASLYLKARYSYLRTPSKWRSYSGEYTYVQKKLLLLDSLVTRPVSTRVLIGRVAGLSSTFLAAW
jgi:hypothetical protein